MKATWMGVCISSMFAVLPFLIWIWFFYGSVNAKFFLVIGIVDVLMLCAAYAYWNGKCLPSVKNRFLLYALGLALCLEYVVAFVGFYPEFSLWSDILRSTGLIFLTHLAVLAVLAGEFLNEADWSLTRRTVAITGGIFGALSLIGIEGLGYTGRFLWANLGINGFTFGNSTFAGAYLLLALIVALAEIVHLQKGEQGRRKVLIASVVLIVFSPALLNVGILWGRTALMEVVANPVLILGSARASSATMLGLLVFHFGLWVITKYLRTGAARAKAVWSTLWLIGIGVGIALLFTSGSSVQERYAEASSAARLYVWNAAWQAFLDRPIFGWGQENFNAGFEAHIDARLFLAENFAQPWFDRAHNIFLDILVTRGVVGSTAIILLVLASLFVIRHARKKEILGEWESMLLYALVPAHVLQMQTGFDTVGSYMLLALFLGYALHLEKITHAVSPVGSKQAARVFAVMLLVVAFFSLKFVWLDEYSRQSALLYAMNTKDETSQIAALRLSIERSSNFEALRLGTSALIKGGLAQVAKNNDQKVQKLVLARLAIYEEGYQRYLVAAPGYYRARVNYVYLLLVKTALGENRLKEAQAIIQDSYQFSPGNPITYVLDSLTMLYQGDLAGATAKIEEGVALNPDVDFIKQVQKYIEEQGKQFPNLSLLKLENL